MRNTLKKLSAQNIRNQNGFTLIEMAVVILLIGMAIAALTPLYNIHLKKERVEVTQASVDEASNAIGAFRSLYGRYPCPASLTAVRGDANYGREDCATDFTGDAGGTLKNGIYIEDSIRAPFEYTNPFTDVTATAAARVRVGALPFRQLNLDEDDAYDAEDNRLMYVVTEHLTFSETFKADQGGIEIQDETGATILGDAAQAGTAHFLTFSYGESNDGAYTRAGVQRPCQAGTLETENCNFDVGQAIYQQSQVNTSGNALTNFDDKLNYFTQNALPLWQLSVDTGDVGNIHHKAEGNLGIRTNEDADVLEESEITGTIRAQDDATTAGTNEGKLISQEICDDTATDCFSPAIIAGTLDNPATPTPNDGTGGLQCPDDDPDGTGTFMVGIRDGAPICEDEVIVRCPPGDILIGVDGNGEAVCDGPPPVGCAATTVSICTDETGTLPSGSNGDVESVYGGDGNRREEEYQCNDGTWELIDTDGDCDCTPVNYAGTRNCYTGYEGTYDWTWVRECPSGNTQYNSTFWEDCTCVEFTQEDFIPCRDGLDGQIRRERERTCDPAGYTNYVEVDDTCTCTEDTETRTLSCAEHEVGNIFQERETSCDSGLPVTGEWTEVNNTCTCQETTETRSLDCPTGQNGSISEERTYDCTAGAWGEWTETSRSCRSCQWTPGSTSTVSSVRTGPRSGRTCACGKAPKRCHDFITAGNYRNYSNCTCE